VITGGTYVAVTAAFPFTVTVQVAPLVEVQPDHEENLLLPAVADAVKVTDVPPL